MTFRPVIDKKQKGRLKYHSSESAKIFLLKIKRGSCLRSMLADIVLSPSQVHWSLCDLYVCQYISWRTAASQSYYALLHLLGRQEVTHESHPYTLQCITLRKKKNLSVISSTAVHSGTYAKVQLSTANALMTENVFYFAFSQLSLSFQRLPWWPRGVFHYVRCLLCGQLFLQPKFSH